MSDFERGPPARAHAQWKPRVGVADDPPGGGLDSGFRNSGTMTSPAVRGAAAFRTEIPLPPIGPPVKTAVSLPAWLKVSKVRSVGRRSGQSRAAKRLSSQDDREARRSQWDDALRRVPCAKGER
jgi:hypothetical protein